MSNAVIEAFDAVNLMTVHAAKGLEFSIVFLVDLGRGTRTHEAPVRVIPDRGDGTPSVTVWPYRSDADDEERRRDLEETKRLFYVATTRARDRLYLSAVVESGTPKLNPGSFGSIFPGGFATVFAHAALASSGGRVVWQGQSGASHTFRVRRKILIRYQRLLSMYPCGRLLPGCQRPVHRPPRALTLDRLLAVLTRPSSARRVGLSTR